MFAQKPPKIKEAIFDFLRGVDIKNFNDIFEAFEVLKISLG